MTAKKTSEMAEAVIADNAQLRMPEPIRQEIEGLLDLHKRIVEQANQINAQIGAMVRTGRACLGVPDDWLMAEDGVFVPPTPNGGKNGD